jgi:hypothetical protein
MRLRLGDLPHTRAARYLNGRPRAAEREGKMAACLSLPGGETRDAGKDADTRKGRDSAQKGLRSRSASHANRCLSKGNVMTRDTTLSVERYVEPQHYTV